MLTDSERKTFVSRADFSLGIHLVLLMQLNARQNLRQYRYARILEQVERPGMAFDDPGPAQ